MGEKERIEKTISLLERALNELELLEPFDLSELKDFLAVSMKIFEIVNITIDLGKEVCYYLNLGVPQSYAEIFKMLRNASFIDNELERGLNSLVFLRNTISHRYYQITEEDIRRALNNLEYVIEFAEKARELVK